jgi:hypothetical protein
VCHGDRTYFVWVDTSEGARVTIRFSRKPRELLTFLDEEKRLVS